LRFASSVTSAKAVDQAVNELLAPIDRRLTPGMVDLVLLFVTSHFRDDLEQITERVQNAMTSGVIIGCTAEGAIGADREFERMPAMSLLAASLPDVDIRPFHVTQADLEGKTTVEEWERLVGVSPETKGVFVAMADPFRLAVLAFVERMNQLVPSSPLVGGIASGASQPGENRLICNGEVLTDGAVGVSMTGALQVDTVVSQGCRPIGYHQVGSQRCRTAWRAPGAGAAARNAVRAVAGGRAPCAADTLRRPGDQRVSPDIRPGRLSHSQHRRLRSPQRRHRDRRHGASRGACAMPIAPTKTCACC
jgi:small ligand-binding sensory domain FIST